MITIGKAVTQGCLPMAGPPFLALSRASGREHHFAQGSAWLDQSDSGQHSTPLAYAAFEFRLALERLIFELLLRVRGDRLDPADEKILRSFKKIENRIYELAGHQRQLDKKIDFVNIIISQAGSSMAVAKVDLGELSSHWHQCSELCHIGWNLLVCGTDGSLRCEAFQTLVSIRDSLKVRSSSIIAWPHLREPSMVELQDRYVKGEATEEDVRSHLREGVDPTVVSPAAI